MKSSICGSERVEYLMPWFFASFFAGGRRGELHRGWALQREPGVDSGRKLRRACGDANVQVHHVRETRAAVGCAARSARCRLPGAPEDRADLGFLSSTVDP